MPNPRLLDLFCGAGGCSVGYARGGFQVVGVDRSPHSDYPFEFHEADATTLDMTADGCIHTSSGACLGLFDAIAASPPCPRYSTITPESARDSHPDLIPVMRTMLRSWGLPYVIENVPGAARHMDHPIRICGSWFGLAVRRHRYFESNVPFLYGTDCLHRAQGRPIGVYGDHAQDDEHYRRPDGTRRGNKAKSVQEAQQAMGIDWMTDWDDLTDAIPPAFTQHIGEQLIDYLTASKIPHQEGTPA